MPFKNADLSRRGTVGLLSPLDMEGYLKLLSKSKPKYRKTLLETAPDKLIRLLGKAALKGHVTKAQEKNLRILAGPSSIKRKRKVIQKGGFNLLNFLPTAIDLGTSLSGVINRAHAGRPDRLFTKEWQDSMASKASPRS